MPTGPLLEGRNRSNFSDLFFLLELLIYSHIALQNLGGKFSLIRRVSSLVSCLERVEIATDGVSKNEKTFIDESVTLVGCGYKDEIKYR